MLLALAVAITMKRCKAKFLLVEADKAPEKAQDELENLPSELFPIRYLLNKIKRLEEKVEENDVEMNEMKKMIEARDEEANLLVSQVKNLSAQVEDFKGLSTIEISFIVTATKAVDYIPQGVITFDEKVIDNSNSFVIEEGKFIVPSSGFYLFLFDSQAWSTKYSKVYVQVNGNLVHSFAELHKGEFVDQLNFMFASRLKGGDELWLFNVYPKTLWSSDTEPMTFVGYKLIELSF